MRNIFLVLLSAVFLFVGCSEDCPTQPTYEVKLNKITIPMTLFSADSIPFTGEYSYLYEYKQQTMDIKYWKDIKFVNDLFFPYTGNLTNIINSENYLDNEYFKVTKKVNVWNEKIEFIVFYEWKVSEEEAFKQFGKSRFKYSEEISFGTYFGLPEKQNLTLYY